MKHMKRWIALLLVMMFIVMSVSACGQKRESEKNSSKNNNQTSDDTDTEKEDTSGDTNTEQGSSEEEQKAGEDWSWPLDEKKELSIWLSWTNEYVNEPNDLVAIQEIEKRTNVHINWTTVLSVEATEKFGLLMASGNYPDILRGVQDYYTGGLVQMCSDDVIYDLTEYVPMYMPNYQAIRTMNKKLERDTVTDDGRMVGVYTIASNFGEVRGERVWDGLCIRQDWLDELGLPVPVTIEDWHETLTAFKENYNCEAPLLIGKENGYDIMHHFLSAYGVLGEFYNDQGTVKYGPLEDGYKQWVQLFRDWYAEGLIDPNFINNDANTMPSAEYIGTGRAGASTNVWGYTADTYKLQGYTDEEDFFLTGVTTPVLKEGDTQQIGYPTSEITKETLCITKNCKDIELACRYLDYWYTEECMLLDSMGLEGDSYIIKEDGSYSFSDKLKGWVENGDYPNLSMAVYVYTLSTSDFGLYNWGAFDPMYEGMRTPEAYDAWDQASFDLMLPPCMTNTEEETIAYNNLYASIKTLKQENTIKFITGARPMEEYDDFIADLYSYGIEDCTRYKQAALDRYYAR